jgi:subtilase family serine protease
MHRILSRGLALFFLGFLVVACSSPINGIVGGGSKTPSASHTGTTPLPAETPTTTPEPFPSDTSANDVCPASISFVTSCQTPQSLRIAYGIQPLIQEGFTGKGQTIVDIVSFGSPTLQQDMNVFDQQFNLPPITIQQIGPLDKTVPVSDPNNDRSGWASETTLDVEIMHALAPDAKIVVLTSPVAETEGTFGLPQFRALLQYSIDHKLGNIISQSWGASEVTLKDAAGQAEIQKWNTLYQQATTKDGLTILSASGDNGATDFTDLKGTKLSTTATTSFPADDPWVTAVGGTALSRSGANFTESAWDSSGGGFSSFFPTPTFQQSLITPTSALSPKARGVPDVSADADPDTGLAMYEAGSWNTAGGTSASTPLWAALVAIADQMANHPLGFLNTTLYQLALSTHYQQDFHDITTGNNSVNSGDVRVEGYNAGVGWDPITGLGSPDAVHLLPDLIAAANSPS